MNYKFQLSSIVRNTPRQVSEDGQMDHCVNLRYDDGAMRPISPTTILTGMDDYDLSDYVSVHMHNSGGYNHMLAVSSDAQLYYIADVSDDYVATPLADPILLLTLADTQITMHQTGHLIAIADGTQIHYLLYNTQTKKYRTVSVDFNGNAEDSILSPDGLIQLRVKQCETTNGDPATRVYIQPDEEEFVEDTTKTLANDGILAETQATTLKAAMIKALDKERTAGRLQGFFMACTAVELYDGTTILMSRPVLCTQPCDAGTRYDFDADHPYPFSSSGPHTHYNYLHKPMPLNMLNFDDIGRFYNNATDERDATVVVKGVEKDSEEKCYTLPTIMPKRPDNDRDREEILKYGYRIDYGEPTDEYQPDSSYYYRIKRDYIDNSKTYKDGMVMLSHGHRFSYTSLFNDCAQTFCPTLIGRIPAYDILIDDESIALSSQLGIEQTRTVACSGAFHTCIVDDDHSEYEMSTARRMQQIFESDYFLRPEHPLVSPPNLFALWTSTLPLRTHDSHDGKTHALAGFKASQWAVYTDDIQLMSSGLLPALSWENKGLRTHSFRKNYCVAITSGKLQYRVKKISAQLSTFKDLIKNINVYMTQPVSAYDTDADPVSTVLHSPMSGLTHLAIAATAYLKHKTNEQIIKELEASSSFYLVHSIPFDSLAESDEWTTIDLKSKGIDLSNLVQQPRLTVDSNDRSSYTCKVVYTYNGRLHVANYMRTLFRGYPIEYFFQPPNDTSTVIAPTSRPPYNEIKVAVVDGYSQVNAQAPIAYLREDPPSADKHIYPLPIWPAKYTFNVTGSFKSVLNQLQVSTSTRCADYILAEIETKDGMVYTYRCRANADAVNNGSRQYYCLNPLLSYPDVRAKSITFNVPESSGYTTIKFPLKAHPFLNFAYYISPDLKPINLFDITDPNVEKGTSFEAKESGDEYVPNGLKVSSANNPLYFPAENTYLVGNSSIKALCANTTAMQDGAFGGFPLMVFCSDGIYSLGVDSSGEMCYTNSRPFSRDIILTPQSLLPIDDAIVFASHRGLMLLRGDGVKELSEAVKGEAVRAWDKSATQYLRGYDRLIGCDNIVTLSDAVGGTPDFFSLINAPDVRIGYNYNLREVWVSSPQYPMTYVLTSAGWTTKTGCYRHFAVDYPHLLGIGTDNRLHLIGTDTAAGNSVTFVTRPIKVSTLDYKRSYRVIIRGQLHVKPLADGSHTAAIIVYASYDLVHWTPVGVTKRPDVPAGSTVAPLSDDVINNLGTTTLPTAAPYLRIAFAADLRGDSTIDHIEIVTIHADNKAR